MATIMKLGSYQFTPVPLIEGLQKEVIRTTNGEKIGTKYSLTLNGTLTPLPDNQGGINNLIPLKNALDEALSIEGQHFYVECNGVVLISTYPRIISHNFTNTNNNWVMTIAYSITLEFADEPAGAGEDSEAMPPYLSSATEDWSIEFLDENNYVGTLPGPITDILPYTIKLTHNLSAQGIEHYTGGSGTGDISGTLDRPAWQEAREWVVDRVGLNTSVLGSYTSGIFNFNVSGLGYFDHIRTNNINESNGEFATTETWLVLPTGNLAGNAVEDFTIDINKSVDDAITKLSIRGNIQGLSTRTYGNNPGDFTINENKYDAALNYWNNVSGRLYNRINTVASGSVLGSLNPIPQSYNVSHVKRNGQISYSYDYDDRPCNLVSGALSEIISINDTYPTDVFSTITVLGRARGPILQAVNTVTVYTRSVSIEVVMPHQTGCSTGIMPSLVAAKPTGQIYPLLCSLETDLYNNYTQVFKSQDSDNWNPRTGRYSRNVTWTYTSCSGTAPDTSFC